MLCHYVFWEGPSKDNKVIQSMPQENQLKEEWMWAEEDNCIVMGGYREAILTAKDRADARWIGEEDWKSFTGIKVNRWKLRPTTCHSIIYCNHTRKMLQTISLSVVWEFQLAVRPWIGWWWLTWALTFASRNAWCQHPWSVNREKPTVHKIVYWL